MNTSPSWIVRTIRIAPLVACMFSGCTCSGTTPKPSQVPTAAVKAAAPAPATEALPVVTATPIEEPATATVAPEPTQAVSPSPTVDDAKLALCKSYVAVISGRTKDPALMKKAELKALARKVPDLVMCAAAAQDSDEICKNLAPDVTDCRKTRTIFHELQNPKGKSYLFSDWEYELCKKSKEMAPYCDALREAFRSGDPDKCPPKVANCRAIMLLDPSLCRDSGSSESDAEGCKADVAHRATLGNGGKGLRTSDAPLDRELAKIASGESKTCDSLADLAVDACLGKPGPVPPPKTGDNPPSEAPAKP